MKLSRLRRVVEKAVTLFLGLVLAAMVALEICQIVGRYTSGTGWLWSTDVNLLLLSTLGWVGAAGLCFARTHLVVNLIGARSRALQQAVLVMADLILLIGVLWLTPKFLRALDDFDQLIMPGLQWSATVKLVPPLTGLILMGTAAVVNLLEALPGVETDPGAGTPGSGANR